MSLLSPLSLWWLALAVPIVVFYILKIRLRRIPVSTILFWQQVFEETKPRSIWQRLRHMLSLFLQLAFLLLLAFALAQPLLPWEAKDARRIVVIVDNSASMNATDVLPTRLSLAKTKGKRIVDGLRFRDEAAILSAGAEPSVICGLTGHAGTLREAIASIKPSDGPTRVKEAVELARGLIAGHPHGRIAILTDNGFEGFEQLAESKDIEFFPLGAGAANLALTAFQVRRSLTDPVGYEILVEVRNFSDEAAECRLELDLADQVVDVIPIRLEANGKFRQVFEKTSIEGGVLKGSLSTVDSLGADNQAWGILPRRDPIPVLFVSSGNLFLDMALQSLPLVQLRKSKDMQAKPAGNEIVVYHGRVPNPLPPGNVFVVDPEDSNDLWTVGEKIANPICAKQDKDSPLMTHIRLDNVLMPEARKLKFTPTANAKVLAASATGDPIFAAIERPQGKVLVLTVNLDRGDLPLRTAFPIMAINAFSWFSGHKGELLESYSSGAIANIELPAGSQNRSLQLKAPDGSVKSITNSAGKLTIGPLEQVGVWSILEEVAPAAQEKPAPILEFACNLANAAESDLRTKPQITEAETQSMLLSGSAWPTWYWLILAAFTLTLTEWCLYQRRWIT